MDRYNETFVDNWDGRTWFFYPAPFSTFVDETEVPPLTVEFRITADGRERITADGQQRIVEIPV